jgi:hypothetical protein
MAGKWYERKKVMRGADAGAGNVGRQIVGTLLNPLRISVALRCKKYRCWLEKLSMGTVDFKDQFGDFTN